MSSETTTKTPEAAAVPPPGPAPVNTKRVPRGHKRLLTRRDRITLGFMAGVPTILHV
ncbi:sugar ABC transporter permease, partial [Streptomyces canus]